MIEVPGNRIILREHQISDLDNYHKWRSDKELMKLSIMPRSLTIQDTFIYLADEIKEQQNPGRKLYVFAIVLKDTQEYIGSSVFNIEKTSARGGVAEIGYFLYREYWKKGFAGEATTLLIDYIFKNHPIHKIIANCDARNTGSEKVMLRCGMVKEGHFIKERCIDGEWSDNLKYSILKKNENL